MSAEKPIRIQRQLTKGWKMPANTVYVGRPTVWVNPWRVGYETASASEAVEMFRFTMTPVEGLPGVFSNFEGEHRDLSPLRGKNLACWCPLDQPCHADVLLELANQEPPS